MEQTLTERIKANFVNKSEPFTLNTKDYTKQFAHVYSSRLKITGDLLQDQIKSKWAGKYPIKRIHELREDEQVTCILIGTIFKHQSFKPSILKEVSEEYQLAPQPKRENYTDETDKIILEDDIQRIRLTGKVPVNDLVTGVVIAVKGYVECDGKFDVEDYIFFQALPEPRSAVKLSEDRYLLLLSGLKLTSVNSNPMQIELLKQWIFGNFPVAGINPASVVRIIVAGNSINNNNEKARVLTYNAPKDTELQDSVKALDTLFADLAKSIPVDVMSGDRDLSNFMMPQQPMHSCMFPNARQNSNFTCVTNPYAIEIDGVQVLGTSGQNIKDVQRNSTIEKSMDGLKSTLTWAHMAPTCPDTLPSYPYYHEDPFVIRQFPQVYFAGNCDAFGTQVFESNRGGRVCMVCIPEFCSTGSGVLVNLKNFECKKVSFNIAMDVDE